MRKIIHIDMDSFYASVEQRDFPELKGKSIAVGGSPDGRGVVATASYEARKYGVKSAMSSRNALLLCPDLIFVKPRFEAYKEVSKQIRNIFSRYTDLIEPLSLDEAYLDVTEDKLGIGSAIEIAKKIKREIEEELNLTASAGVSINKFIAKIASDINKPDGLTFIGPSKIIPFLESLPIEKFFGVGKVTAAKMKSKGIFVGRDLKNWSEERLSTDFGKSGSFFYHMVRGNDDRPVRPNRIAKSIGVEDTFETDLRDSKEIEEELKGIVYKLEKRLRVKAQMGRTVTLKVKYADFIQLTRSITISSYVSSFEEIITIVLDLLKKIDLEGKRIRLLGVSISNFYDSDIERMNESQLSLF